MGFLDDISKTLNDASQGAIQKGKDMADTAKLNSLISDDEKLITDLYQQIGEMYVEDYAYSATGKYAEYVAAIRAANERIAERKQKVQELKGVTNCPCCGAQIPSGAAFCATCGNRLVAPVQQMGYHCNCCGAVVADGCRFCTVCGQPTMSPMNNNNQY